MIEVVIAITTAALVIATMKMTMMIEIIYMGWWCNNGSRRGYNDNSGESCDVDKDNMTSMIRELAVIQVG